MLKTTSLPLSIIACHTKASCKRVYRPHWARYTVREFASKPRLGEARTDWSLLGRRSRYGSSLAIGNVNVAKAAEADVCLLRMTREPFKNAQARAVLADKYGRFVSEDSLIGTSLQELAHPQAAREACSTGCRQRVVRADNLVSIGNVRAGAEEKRTVVAKTLQEEVRVARHHLHVF